MTPPRVRPAAVAPLPAPPVARADPRIQARRIAVRRTEGRRRLRRLLWATGVVAAVGLAIGATRTPLLDVDHVEVEGAGSLPVPEVIEVVGSAGGELGAPLADIDERAVERALEALPVVAAADVERSWPGTLRVEIAERTPVAALPTGSATAVVAADGVVIDVVPAAPAGLPILAGRPVDLEPGAVLDAPALLAVAAALPADVAAAVAVVTAGADGEVELRLADGGIARLGPPSQLGAKLVAVATVLDQVDRTCLATVDVRVPSAPAVTRTPGCAS